jgi:hypothetical protein
MNDTTIATVIWTLVSVWMVILFFWIIRMIHRDTVKTREMNHKADLYPLKTDTQRLAGAVERLTGRVETLEQRVQGIVEQKMKRNRD